ncbi:lysosomal acid lipase-related [Holotrichia oblita]|uniref:Lysosomal acid lipase-related n=1 Tax=Holotrichia oblita TaxID=644536 RepID=A0ACB9SJG5_HOLOL|nr:lysosomal acid lipase-related [Holotrichia oblita]
MIQRHGYEVEEHVDVQTSDGYLLDLHRIPYGKDNSDETKKPVVFLMHGLLSSSADWVNMGAEKSLAYQLADAGYDVWMGNARGNKWSRKHISYNPDSNSAFWDFSWHEIGAIDLPTMIDYVLETTGQEQLFYIGHSQGTTSFWVMGAERPEYNDKIKLMVALAPIAYMSNLTNPFFQLASAFHNTLEWVLSFLGVDEFLPSTGLMELIGQASCNDESMFQGVCASIYFLIGGWNSAQLNATMIPVILTNAPAGAATKQLLHYAQGINSGHFRRYDHGWISNLIQYGSISPPSYDTSAIRAPVALLYSANDWLAAIIVRIKIVFSQDVKQLESELPNVVTSYLVSDSKFNHLDFVFAIDIRELLYDRVLTLLEKYQ